MGFDYIYLEPAYYTFEGKERKVINCMVGDHAPSFISDLSVNENLNNNSDISRRMVPYVIWSNYEMKMLDNIDTSFANMIDLCPMTLYAAGIELSPFYQTVLSLHESFPLRTNTGTIRNSLGIISQYNSQDPQFSILNEYYNLEYNSLLETEEYKESLFK